MRYRYSPAYIRSIKTIKDIKRRIAIHNSIKNFQEVIEKSIQPPAGLGLKRLKDNIWEFRAGLKDRILIRWTKDLIEYGIAGTHDEIRNYLRHL